MLILVARHASKWLADEKPHFVPDPESGKPADLLPHVKKAFNAKQLCTYLLKGIGNNIFSWYSLGI